MRELAVAAGFSTLVLGIFMIFVGLGWPGEENVCVTDKEGKRANSCYCEQFDRADIGEPGVRQPFNTWSNLYALVTGGALAVVIYLNRRKGLQPAGTNRMRSTSFYPLLYIAIVIFLGLGSMWFHASLTQWGGIFDNLSMFTFTNFLIFYTIVRLTNVDLMFYIGYPLSTVLLTFIAALGASSLIVTLFSVAVYLVFEGIIWLFKPDVRNDWPAFWKFWLPGTLSILLATALWIPSQTGGPLCLKTHAFQFHGLWHMGAGASAVLLYFFWRSARR